MSSRRGRFGRSSNRLGAVEVLDLGLHRTWWVQALLVLWRWLFELTAVVLLLVAYFHLRTDMPSWAAVCVIVAPVAVALNVPILAWQLRGWFWVMVTRHRLRTALVQLGARNRSGRLPWLVAWRPTPVGERVWLFMVAGLSVDDIAGQSPALAAAVGCREVRVEKHRKRSMLVRVDLIRRDPLETRTPITSRLMAGLKKTLRVGEDDPRAGINGDPLPGTAEPTSRPGGSVSWLHAPIPTPASPPSESTSASSGRSRVSSTETNSTASAAPPVVVNGEDLSDYV